MTRTTGSDILVIGCDPGPMAGILTLIYTKKQEIYIPAAMPRIMQCDADSALYFLEWLIKHYKRCRIVIGYETYVIGHRSGRTNNRGASTTTSKMGGRIDALASDQVAVCAHRMVDIAEWASDERLRVSGLLAITIGMKHARAAARHALYTARTAGAPDPLSKRYRRPDLPVAAPAS